MRVLDGAVVWFTGLPASGKSTLARKLVECLLVEPKAELLDMDDLRQHCLRDLDHSLTGRRDAVRRLAVIAANISHTNRIAVCTSTSSMTEGRDYAESLAKNFVLVHTWCPLPICKRRDRERGSNLYERAEKGELPGFPGVSGEYEIPQSPDLVLDTWTGAVPEHVLRLLVLLRDRGVIDEFRRYR